MRGHSLLWDRASNNPGWVGQLSGSQLRTAMENRLDTAVAMYEGMVVHWDVINEMIGNDFYGAGTGEPGVRVDMINRAKQVKHPADYLRCSENLCIDT